VVEQEGGRRRGRVYHREKLLGNQRRMYNYTEHKRTYRSCISLTRTEVSVLLLNKKNFIYSNDIKSEENFSLNFASQSERRILYSVTCFFIFFLYVT
jgi:hypothetical protein